MRTLAVAALFGVGYPVALTVLARGRAVLAERRWRWFLAHQLAMVAITAGRPGAPRPARRPAC